MFVLNAEERANHRFKFIVGVEGANGVIREARDEFGANAVNFVTFVGSRGFNNFVVKIARRDGDIKAMGSKVTSGPFIVRSDKDGAHFGVFTDFTANKVKSFRCSHGVKDVMEAVIFGTFGVFDLR